MRRVLAGLVTVLAVMAGVAPVAAQVLPPSDAPQVVDPRPASGEMVASGSVTIGARVVGDQPLGTVVVRIDGRDAGTSTPGTRRATPGALEATVRAVATLTPGDHVAQVLVDDHVLRAWRFTVSDLHVTRLYGTDRVTTAVEVSRDCYRVDGTAEAAVLAGLDQLPDALAGASLAGAVNGPLLLTSGEYLDAAVAAELSRVLPDGAQVFLLGGAGPLSERLERDVVALGFTPERVGDPVAAAQHMRPAMADSAGSGTVVLASADALDQALPLVGPAAAGGWPILLTGRDALDPQVRDYLQAAPPAEVLIAAAPNAISTAVLREAWEVSGRVTRVHGRDHAALAQIVAERFFDDPEVVTLASQDEIAIALAGGAHAAAAAGPMLLVEDELGDELATSLGAEPPRRVVVLGDLRDVDERVVGELHRAVADRDGPRLRSITPAPHTTVRGLDRVVVRFDRRVLPAHSTLTLWIDGHEVTGALSADGPTGLALDIDHAFPQLAPGRHDMRLVGAATDGQHWLHIDEVLTWVEPPV